ncbi:MAG: ABC transporter permease [Chitinophagales bacterium]|nr:ABC transporter permease [Chitinophagales bacterium]
MNFPFFIAKKIASNTQRSFARFILKIAVAAVALSIMVMIISTALISGFQQTISNKVFGFWAHVIVTPFKAYDSLDKYPISKTNNLYTHPETYTGIEHIQAIALKGGILHTKTDFEGIVLKGIGKDFRKENVVKNIVKGQLFDLKEEKNNTGILISNITAKRLGLDVGDKILLSFFEDNAKVRKRNFVISGIYDSGVEEFDKQYAWIDIAVIQNLNDWNEDEVGGFEIFLDSKKLDEPKLKTYAKK